jgi:DNA-binding response OmpR family regulator
MGNHRVVVIEDNRDIAELVERALHEAGFEVQVVRNGIDGLEAASDDWVDLVVLDLMLPGMDGLEVCRRLRALRPELLVLMLTAKTSELDRVLGLEIGADDYLGKPFSLRELQARAKALLRRREAMSVAGSRGSPIVHGSFAIDPAGRTLTMSGREVRLTAREFDLLAFLARNAGQVYGRDELLQRVWGPGFDGFAHTVNSHINRLRTKVELDATDPQLIQTVWGRGYKFVPPPSGTP